MGNQDFLSFCIIFDVVKTCVFFPILARLGFAFLCFGWISVFFGEALLIWVPQAWSETLWCQNWNSSTEAQWKAGPLWSHKRCAQIHPKRLTMPLRHNSALASSHLKFYSELYKCLPGSDDSWLVTICIDANTMLSQSEHKITSFALKPWSKCISWCLIHQRIQAKMPIEWKTLKAATISGQKCISVHFSQGFQPSHCHAHCSLTMWPWWNGHGVSGCSMVGLSPLMGE